MINNLKVKFSTQKCLQNKNQKKMLLNEQISKKDCLSISSRAYFQSLNKSNKADISDGFMLEPSIIVDQKESSELRISQIVSWNGSPLRVLYYVSKFIKQLKQSASKVKFRSITLRILNIINDKASNSAMLGQQNNKYIFIDIFKNFIIEPDSKYKIIWDLSLFLSVLTSLFYLPIYISFNIEKDDVFIFFEILPSILLILDMLVCCFTAFYKQGLIQRERIVQNYVTTYLFQDLIVVLPGILNLLSLQYIRLLLLLRIIKIPRMIKSLEELINLKENYANIFQLIKLGFFVILVCHYCACIWAYIGLYQNQLNLQSWLIKYNLDDNNLKSIYITSLYFSVITTLTIGYGDITPQTDIEKMYVIFVALLICALLAYSISTIGNIFKSMSEKQDQFKSQMNIITRYMKAKNLSPQIQIQVKKFYEHFFNQESLQTNQAELLLQNLNKDLKENIAVEIYFKLLKQQKLFNQMSDEFVRRICITIKEKTFIQGNVIYNKDDQIKRLYYLLKGEITYLANNKTIQIQIQGPIAEKEFISQENNITTIISSQFSQVVYVDYDELINIIKDYNEDFQRFSMLSDNINYNEPHRNFGQICEICKWTHQFIKCPYIFVTINKSRVLKQLKLSQEQFRESKNRSYVQYRTFQQIKITQENALAIILQHELIKDEDLNDQYLMQLGFSNNYWMTSQTLQISDLTRAHFRNSSEVIQSLNQERNNVNQSSIKPKIMKNSQNSQQTQANAINSQYDIKSRQLSYSLKQQSFKLNNPTSLLQNFINSRGRIASQNSEKQLENEDQDSSEQSQAELQVQAQAQVQAQFQRLDIINNTTQSDMLTVMEKQIEQSLYHNRISLNIDKFQIYQIYYPSYNVDIILKQIKSSKNNKKRFQYLSVFRRNFTRIS